MLSPGVHAGHFAPYNACMSAPKRFTSAYEQAYYCIARAAKKIKIGAKHLSNNDTEFNLFCSTILPYIIYGSEAVQIVLIMRF